MPIGQMALWPQRQILVQLVSIYYGIYHFLDFSWGTYPVTSFVGDGVNLLGPTRKLHITQQGKSAASYSVDQKYQAKYSCLNEKGKVAESAPNPPPNVSITNGSNYNCWQKWIIPKLGLYNHFLIIFAYNRTSCSSGPVIGVIRRKIF